jgi:peptide deformylase
MTVTIVEAGAPVLRQRATEVAPEAIATPAFAELVAAMTAAMRGAPGVGLAAPQIGVGQRVIVLEDRAELIARLTAEERRERERAPFPLQVIVNPQLRTIGDERTVFFEGCLSVPGYVALVERHREVEVTGLDAQGAALTWRVSGWPSRILQHEVDHLDGILYVDRMITRSFVAEAQARARFTGRPIAEIRDLLGL